jgi:hypothetical protein
MVVNLRGGIIIQNLFSRAVCCQKVTLSSRESVIVSPQLGDSGGREMQSVARKETWKEYHISLAGKTREDGSLFVTSPNLPPFSAVIADGNWNSVTDHLQRFIEVNFGRVKTIRLIHDASELVARDVQVPPAFVIAEFSQDRVSTG